MWAAAEGKTKTVRLLLDRDANVNARTRHAWTALHYAVDRGRAETAQLLIDRGADVAARNSLGKAPRELSGDLKLRWPESAKSGKNIPDAQAPAESSDKATESADPAAENGQGRPDTQTSRQGDPPTTRAPRDSALPAGLPEWKYVDANADVWLLRHLPKQNDQIRRLLPDVKRKLSGLVWTAYAEGSKPFREVYVPLPGKNVEDIARTPWIKSTEKEIPKELAALLEFTTAPDGVVTMTIPREARTPSEIERLRHLAEQLQEPDVKIRLFGYFVFYLASSQGILR